jgi:hypothetical protein
MDENPRQRHRQKIIAGNNDTNDNLPPVSFTPVNTGDKHKVASIVKIWNAPTNGILGRTGLLIPENNLKWKARVRLSLKAFVCKILEKKGANEVNFFVDCINYVGVGGGGEGGYLSRGHFASLPTQGSDY